MIRHVVMWVLNDPADAGRFAEQLLSCRGIVPGMGAFDVGRRSEALAASADVCLVADFADAAALAAYAGHPHHRAVSDRLTPLRRSRTVLDFEVSG